MKKNILNLTAIALIATTLVYTGCKKEDTTAPVITVTGGETQTVILNSSFTDQGATATDDEDGEITPTVSGSVNVDLVGTYVLTYTATDAAGNVAEATRTVTVRNEADIYEGTYTCSDPDFGTITWQQTITASTTVNKRITFDKFAYRTGNNTVTADLTGGTAFTLYGPTTSGPLGTGGCQFTYTQNGAGATITQNSGKYTFTVKYYEEALAGGSGCVAVIPTAFEDTFVQN